MKIGIELEERGKLKVLGKNHSRNSMCENTEEEEMKDRCSQSTVSKEKNDLRE